MSLFLRFIVFIIVATEVSFGQADPFLRTIDTVKHGVAPVVCMQRSQAGEWSVFNVDGSGFFWTPQGGFLTAAHVIRGLVDEVAQTKGCIPAIYVPIGGWQNDAEYFDAKWFQFKLSACHTDTALDLAYCDTDEDLTQKTEIKITTLKLNEVPLPDGSPIAFTGFPLSATLPMTARGYVAAYREAIRGIGATELMMDRSSWPGASGSAVYDTEGKVVGIVLQSGVNQGSGLTYARSGRAIGYFLKKIGHLKAEDPAVTSSVH